MTCLWSVDLSSGLAGRDSSLKDLVFDLFVYEKKICYDAPVFLRSEMVPFYSHFRIICCLLFVFLAACDRKINVLSMGFSYHNPEIVYAGGTGGRFYKSTDGGNVFEQMNAGLTTYNITAIAVNPSLSSVIYAGSYGDSVYRSVDSGGHWNIARHGLDDNVGTQAVNAVVVDPEESARVYVGTNHGVYVTVDGGSLWTSANMGMANRFVIALVMHPGNRSILFAGTHEGLYKTTNSARQWRGVSPKSKPWAVNAVRFDPVNPDTVYAGTNQGVFKSVDGGETWDARNNGFANPFVSSLALDQEDSNILYAGNREGVFQSTDGGASWRLLEHSPPSILTLAA